MSDDVTEFLANLSPEFANSAPYTYTFNGRIHGGSRVDVAHEAAKAAKAARGCLWPRCVEEFARRIYSTRTGSAQQ